jgi:hypothetical protein
MARLKKAFYTSAACHRVAGIKLSDNDGQKILGVNEIKRS